MFPGKAIPVATTCKWEGIFRMKDFYNRLSYSFGNEDWTTEQDALKLKPNDRVFCITASGDRPLHLLLTGCKEIVSIDANPVQDYLLQLKSAAMDRLTPEEFQAFIGTKPCCNRKEISRKLVNHISKEAGHYWKSQENMIEKGVLFSGHTEKWIKRVNWTLRMLRGKEINTLFSIKDLKEQKEFLKDKWNHKLWRAAMKLALNRFSSTVFFNDPGLYAYLDANMHPGVYIYEQMMCRLEHELARDNPFISFYLWGQVAPEAYPPYLQTDGIEKIKPHLSKIESHVGNAITYLEAAPHNSFDAFSLSDIASYMDQASFLRILKAMYLAAKPGARFCLRQFMSRYKIPEGLSPYFKRDHKLESDLSHRDKGFIYDFMAGTVLKD